MIRIMARFNTDPDSLEAVRTLGEALAALRRERGLSQAEAGQKLGMTSQGWGLYEAGKRPGLFRPDIQRRLTGALEATPEDLALLTGAAPATAPPAAGALEARGRDYDPGPSSAKRRLQLSNDDLAPWAASGVVLEYVPGRWPRQGQGCVIEMQDGDLRPRLYEGADSGTLFVRGAGALDREERIDRDQTKSVSAVTARLDEQ